MGKNGEQQLLSVQYFVTRVISEPFFRGALSQLEAWQVKEGDAYGLKVGDPRLAGASFSWRKQPENEPALRLHRSLDVNVQRFEKLILLLQCQPLPDGQREYELKLEDADRLTRITIAVYATADGTGQGQLAGIGLQDAEQLKQYREYWNQFDPRWRGYLKPREHEPEFSVSDKLFITKNSLRAFARKTGNT